VDGKRTILTLKEVKHNLLSNAQVANSVGKDDVFVVLGGGRGITSQCAIALAKEFKCKLVLLGRTVLKEETFRLAASGTTKRELREHYISKYKNQDVKPIELEKMISSAANQIEIRQTIQEIINVGGQALYFDCDATEITSLQKCLSEAEVSFGKITGLVHGAGVLADKKIQRKTPEDFEAVFYTKVKALEAVLQCVNPEQLKYLLLFSSAAAFFGSDGQTDYSMANEVLNKIAYQHKRLHQNTVISSINWGPWDGGMVTPIVKQKMKDKGINVIPVDIGAKYFIEEIKRQSMVNKACQVVIG
jgi:NAD(P)-dependent dehydrogenase (short-subunit alcohol dehydrogenase family)